MLPVIGKEASQGSTKIRLWDGTQNRQICSGTYSRSAAQLAGLTAETQQSGNPKKQTCRPPIGMLARSAARIMAVRRAVVQTFATDATKRSGTLRGSCGENCIPNFGRSFAIDAELSEFLPYLRRRFPVPCHVFGDRGLANFDAELEELAMDLGRTPQRVGKAHFADQSANFDCHLRSAAASSRFQSP